MRTLVAALLGGLVLFVWGFLSHAVLPLGDIGLRQAGSEDAVLAALREGLPGEGVYLLPGLAPEAMADPAAQAAYSAKAVAGPNAVVVYQPQGRDGLRMGPQLALEWLTNTLAAALVAWVLSLLPSGMGRRIAVAVAVAMGVFAWLVVAVPQMNWYRFPLDFTLAALLQHAVGWLLAGAVIARVLVRRAAG